MIGQQSSKLWFPAVMLLTFTLVLCAINLTCVATHAHAANPADIGPRFERIIDEHHDPNTNHAQIFEVWHDRASGQEFVCVESHDSNGTGGLDGIAYPISCFLTGRKW
jgi:hypothetical protein